MEVIRNKEIEIDATLCKACKGWGQVLFDEGEYVTCNNCKGTGKSKKKRSYGQ